MAAFARTATAKRTSGLRVWTSVFDPTRTLSAMALS